VIRQKVVQPAAVPHHPLPGNGVLLGHRRGLPVDIDLVGPSSQEERGRAAGVDLFDAVVVAIVCEGPNIQIIILCNRHDMVADQSQYSDNSQPSFICADCLFLKREISATDQLIIKFNIWP
jgi:hypothetical protein